MAWTIDFEDLEIGREIGSGGFGKVYKGEYLQTPVAIKKIHIAPDDPNRKDLEKFLIREIETIKLFRHPNVIQFVGVAENDGILYIVTELVPGGDLQWYLKNRQVDLPWLLRINIAYDVTLAMSYLHSKNIVHRDLKSSNLLIDTQWKVKVCDFGFARIVDDENNKSMTICGTDNWMAPEMITGQDYDERCDVFSFGMLLFELITRTKPTPNMRNQDFGVNSDIMMAQVVADCPIPFVELMQECCKFNPNDRPSFKLITQSLKTMRNSLYGPNPVLEYPALRQFVNQPAPTLASPVPGSPGGGLIADAKKIMSTGSFDTRDQQQFEEESDYASANDTFGKGGASNGTDNQAKKVTIADHQPEEGDDQDDEDYDEDEDMEERDGEQPPHNDEDDYDEDVDHSDDDEEEDEDEDDLIVSHQTLSPSSLPSSSVSGKKNVSFNISKISYHTYEKESDDEDEEYDYGYDDEDEDDYDDYDEDDEEIDYGDDYDPEQYGEGDLEVDYDGEEDDVIIHPTPEEQLISEEDEDEDEEEDDEDSDEEQTVPAVVTVVQEQPPVEEVKVEEPAQQTDAQEEQSVPIAVAEPVQPAVAVVEETPKEEPAVVVVATPDVEQLVHSTTTEEAAQIVPETPATTAVDEPVKVEEVAVIEEPSTSTPTPTPTPVEVIAVAEEPVKVEAAVAVTEPTPIAIVAEEPVKFEAVFQPAADTKLEELPVIIEQQPGKVDAPTTTIVVEQRESVSVHVDVQSPEPAAPAAVIASEDVHTESIKPTTTVSPVVEQSTTSSTTTISTTSPATPATTPSIKQQEQPQTQASLPSTQTKTTPKKEQPATTKQSENSPLISTNVQRQCCSCWVM
ncbi:hypothetical protein SAMD00019534_035860 [Acytostelium subglobosum LB1]|uniref:hypothetical protein n=1 Tax=Acytostelium subglobosum LB1 TaxID=1410327 RepID=UPI0006447E88|nr:hypothetical protein SAMD00019534_035860 [Acytostelium subglobosum LB1]GAM20411.1 hypothetical protein SAMD00019534_035860 [Acytostelium subglobosum LB1]|eukprot:XP_012759932.1 hypothetical protein SAMD00019534_035860 [Acytostelium subglobosum LB1]